MSISLTSFLGKGRLCSSPVVFITIMWAFLILPPRKKNHCLYYPKEKRLGHHFLLFCCFTLLPPASPPWYPFLSWHCVYIFLSCIMLATVSHYGHKYQQNRALICLPYLVLSREKHIIVVGENNKLCTHLFSSRWMNTSGNILLTLSCIIPELWTRDHSISH